MALKHQAKINTFMRRYADPFCKVHKNAIKLSKANSYEHNMAVCKCCLWFLKEGIPFYTEVRLKTGVRPDIIVPTHVKQIIEVMHTEDIQKFNELKKEKYPKELLDEIIFIQTEEPFNPEGLQ